MTHSLTFTKKEYEAIEEWINYIEILMKEDKDTLKYNPLQKAIYTAYKRKENHFRDVTKKVKKEKNEN